LAIHVVTESHAWLNYDEKALVPDMQDLKSVKRAIDDLQETISKATATIEKRLDKTTDRLKENIDETRQELEASIERYETRLNTLSEEFTREINEGEWRDSFSKFIREQIQEFDRVWEERQARLRDIDAGVNKVLVDARQVEQRLISLCEQHKGDVQSYLLEHGTILRQLDEELRTKWDQLVTRHQAIESSIGRAVVLIDALPQRYEELAAHLAAQHRDLDSKLLKAGEALQQSKQELVRAQGERDVIAINGLEVVTNSLSSAFTRLNWK
jgi:hypothetical protein